MWFKLLISQLILCLIGFFPTKFMESILNILPYGLEIKGGKPKKYF